MRWKGDRRRRCKLQVEFELWEGEGVVKVKEEIYGRGEGSEITKYQLLMKSSEKEIYDIRIVTMREE